MYNIYCEHEDGFGYFYCTADTKEDAEWIVKSMNGYDEFWECKAQYTVVGGR